MKVAIIAANGGMFDAYKVFNIVQPLQRQMLKSASFSRLKG